MQNYTFPLTERLLSADIAELMQALQYEIRECKNHVEFWQGNTRSDGSRRINVELNEISFYNCVSDTDGNKWKRVYVLIYNTGFKPITLEKWAMLLHLAGFYHIKDLFKTAIANEEQNKP